MTSKVKLTHSNKSRERTSSAKVREGKVVYQHPKGYFVVIEFQGAGGKFREAFYPEQIEKVG
ncbi:MAG TPA: hypothetical protein GXX36_10490 [Clostridiaceae bacterium]|nr:hypothetical protein [Clostridiaceae bacterium]